MPVPFCSLRLAFTNLALLLAAKIERSFFAPSVPSRVTDENRTKSCMPSEEGTLDRNVAVGLFYCLFVLTSSLLLS